MMIFIIAFVFALAATAILVWPVRYIARRFGFIDTPHIVERKLHNVPAPLLGGLAMFVVFFIGAYFFRDIWIPKIETRFIWLILASSIVLMLAGIIDDKKNLKPAWQTFFVALAAIIVILGGMSIRQITNPFGGIIELAGTVIPINLGFFTYNFLFIADIITFFWLAGMMFTTKLLDGLDGLVSSLTMVGAIVIALFTLFTKFYQPEVAILASLLAGCCAGFLLWNWHPAKIFLGEGGSLWTGFMLGVLGIISGSKIATTLLVLGVPAMDMLWVIIRRAFFNHTKITEGDRGHLHYRLMKSGLTQNQTVMLFNIMGGVFGIAGLYLSRMLKIYALLLVVVLTVIVGWATVYYFRENKK